MIHCFKFKDKYYIYHTESGSLSLCDELTYIAANKTASDNYSDEEIAEAEKELAEFENSFNIKEEEPYSPTGEIKALCLNVTHDCNLRCGYCFADGGTFHGERELMSSDTGRKAVDFLIAKSGKRKNIEIDFFGGEPLMNFGTVKDVIAYAKEKACVCNKNFRFTITTNGVLLNDEITDYLNREMYNVVMSLDGTRDTNDRVRKTLNGKGSYDIIKDKFLKLAAMRGGKAWYARGTFTHLNADFAKDALHLNDLGFSSVSVEPVVLPDSHPLALTDEDIQTAVEQYTVLAEEFLKRRKNGKKFEFFHFYINLTDGPCLKKRLTGCGAGNEYVAVAPNGDIYPCHQFVGNAPFRMGSVNDPEILAGGFNENIQRRFAGSNLLTKPECRDCFAKYHCSGGCAANNYNFNGDIDKPYKKACELMRKRTECALGIYAEEHAAE